MRKHYAAHEVGNPAAWLEMVQKMYGHFVELNYSSKSLSMTASLSEVYDCCFSRIRSLAFNLLVLRDYGRRCSFSLECCRWATPSCISDSWSHRSRSEDVMVSYLRAFAEATCGTPSKVPARFSRANCFVKRANTVSVVYVLYNIILCLYSYATAFWCHAETSEEMDLFLSKRPRKAMYSNEGKGKKRTKAKVWLPNTFFFLAFMYWTTLWHILPGLLDEST